MANLNLQGITKVYDDGTRALEDINFSVKDRELLALLGPSGCGKSTLLRIIAGLEEATEGEIFLDGRDIADVEPKDRDIAMVFQSYALYPHLDVYENMAFGLKIRKTPKEEIERKVSRAAEALELEDILKKKPGALSGGQRQRVALGRAMVRDPKVFLMDEPLSNLDAKLRVQMRHEIVELQRDLGVAMVYVTHDQTEAMTMADRIVVLDKGKIQQIGTPTEIYKRPENLFVASFIGSVTMNFLGEREGRESLLLSLPTFDEEVVLGIRPENLRMAEGGEFTLRLAENHGALRYYYLEKGETTLKVMSAEEEEKKIGETYSLEVRDEDDVHVFSRETGMRIER
ncbi:MAG: sn-glycerol-3-phosphate ABC transporter ATP-binding protein UgpC [Peptoniphilus sp.]|nr:sn-glycerol-3-phosphate ABC transporter ATP-binding protein UgpC [Peptoniphilus sp.]MDD7363020.1 sn-glycerol-3-phosphate ABC transporter ATP-binding protein UgpC [Bacillota bacterium]MDY6045285.1 sn-glycerol-3-phosphate ABC transporter ATP-binding protein UgpC [Peptoniphilus sp.]